MFCSDFRPKKDIPVPISAGRIASRVVARLFRPFEFQGGVGDSRVFEQVFDPVLERWNLFRVADGDMGIARSRQENKAGYGTKYKNK